jgi:hypothetical protein
LSNNSFSRKAFCRAFLSVGGNSTGGTEVDGIGAPAATKVGDDGVEVAGEAVADVAGDERGRPRFGDRRRW